MSGGVGTRRPFEFNVKCVVFTALVAATWKYLPRDGLWPWLLVLWWPYVAMAWYDELYDCADKLGPTALPFGRTVFLPFKPPGYKRRYRELPPDAKAVMDRVDHVFAWMAISGVVAWALVNRVT
jgi:hypothetical protein